MNALQKVLNSFLPPNCLLKGTSLSEKGRSFAIKKERGDRVVGARLPVSPGKGKSCDAVFLCKKAGSKMFGVVLVELKGGDTGKAIKQVRATSKRLCRKGKRATGPHEPAKLENARKLGQHGGIVKAFIVAGHGLAQRQADKARLLGEGINLTIKSRKRLEIGCAEVA